MHDVIGGNIETPQAARIGCCQSGIEGGRKEIAEFG